MNDRDGLVPNADQELKWGVRSCGIGGSGSSKLVSELFDTEDEAQVRILEGFEYDLQNKNSSRPIPYYSEVEIREVNEEMILEEINKKN